MKLAWSVILSLLVSLLGHCASQTGEPDETAINSTIKRSCLKIREIGWAGSITNAGVHDPDDDFLEFHNEVCNLPINMSGWKIMMRGDITRTYIVPKTDVLVQPNELIVIAAKKDGAFGGVAKIILEGMHFPFRNFGIRTETNEDFLIENELNARDDIPLAGGYDGFTVRSMERTEDRFDEEGGSFTSWHTSTPCNEALAGATVVVGNKCTTDSSSIGITGTNVGSNYSQRTFATPGETNSDDYSLK